MEKKLSGEGLVALLNGGGWMAVGGRVMRDDGGFMPSYSVVRASIAKGLLTIATAEHTFAVPSDRIFLVEEYMVDVRCEFMRRQQKKKVDGGGWEEVSTIGVALRLSNPAIEKVVKKAREAEEWEKQKEHLRREEEERRQNELAFGQKLTKAYVGKKIVSVSVFDGAITFELDNGLDLFVSLAAGDTDDAAIKVNGFSLRTFEFERD